MDKNAFLHMLTDAFQREKPLSLDMSLADIPEWDSLSAMLTLSIAKQRFGKSLKLADFKKDMRVEDLYVLLTQA